MTGAVLAEIAGYYNLKFARNYLSLAENGMEKSCTGMGESDCVGMEMAQRQHA